MVCHRMSCILPYSAEEKALILETAQQAQARTSWCQTVAWLGLSQVIYNRWRTRQETGSLTEGVVGPHRRVQVPAPAEGASACGYPLVHPQISYKWLTWQMVDEDAVYNLPGLSHPKRPRPPATQRDCGAGNSPSAA